MRFFFIPAWLLFLLLGTTSYISKVNGAPGDTPLIRAVRKNNLDLVKRLLDNGADAKATSNSGYTALMFAAKFGTEKMLKLLLPMSNAKGQLISKRLLEKIIWTKIATKKRRAGPRSRRNPPYGGGGAGGQRSRAGGRNYSR